jgi:hypothetical protein
MTPKAMGEKENVNTDPAHPPQRRVPRRDTPLRMTRIE